MEASSLLKNPVILQATNERVAVTCITNQLYGPVRLFESMLRGGGIQTHFQQTVRTSLADDAISVRHQVNREVEHNGLKRFLLGTAGRISLRPIYKLIEVAGFV